MLVDDEHLALHHDVVLVLLEQLLGPHRVVEVADQRGVRALVEVVDPEVVLDPFDSGLQDADRALLLIDLVVAVALQPLHDAGELDVPLGRLVGRAGDDQRRAGLVDQDRVDLVDDRERVAALNQLGAAPGHVVAQVVEAELVVGAVGDVARVHLAALSGGHRRQDAPGAEPQEPVHAAHQVGLVLGQVVVDRHDVHAVASEGIEVRRSGGHERLALTGAHLGDVAEVQGGPTHHLDVEVPLAEGATGRLAHGCKRFGQ